MAGRSRRRTPELQQWMLRSGMLVGLGIGGGKFAEARFLDLSLQPIFNPCIILSGYAVGFVLVGLTRCSALTNMLYDKDRTIVSSPKCVRTAFSWQSGALRKG